jgi:hypothetical protein
LCGDARLSRILCQFFDDSLAAVQMFVTRDRRQTKVGDGARYGVLHRSDVAAHDGNGLRRRLEGLRPGRADVRRRNRCNLRCLWPALKKTQQTPHAMLALAV